MITKTTYEPDGADLLRRYFGIGELEEFCRELREKTAGSENVYIEFKDGVPRAHHTERSKDPYT